MAFFVCPFSLAPLVLLSIAIGALPIPWRVLIAAPLLLARVFHLNLVVACVWRLLVRPKDGVPVVPFEKRRRWTNDPIRDDDLVTPSDKLPRRLPRWTSRHTDVVSLRYKTCDPNAIGP